jgi:hypothetical protein
LGLRAVSVVEVVLGHHLAVVEVFLVVVVVVIMVVLDTKVVEVVLTTQVLTRITKLV